MNNNQKKQVIFNCIDLGMDNHTAYLYASCTPDEIEELEGDETFQNQITAKVAALEYSLLQQHEQVIALAVERGQAAPLQWKLERVNPGRWGTSNKQSEVPIVIPSIVINKVIHGKKESA